MVMVNLFHTDNDMCIPIFLIGLSAMFTGMNTEAVHSFNVDAFSQNITAMWAANVVLQVKFCSVVGTYQSYPFGYRKGIPFSQ